MNQCWPQRDGEKKDIKEEVLEKTEKIVISSVGEKPLSNSVLAPHSHSQTPLYANWTKKRIK